MHTPFHQLGSGNILLRGITKLHYLQYDEGRLSSIEKLTIYILLQESGNLEHHLLRIYDCRPDIDSSRILRLRVDWSLELSCNGYYIREIQS